MSRPLSRPLNHLPPALLYSAIAGCNEETRYTMMLIEDKQDPQIVLESIKLINSALTDILFLMRKDS